MFFIAYTFKGQVHVFAGQVKIVSHSSCRTSAILKYQLSSIEHLQYMLKLMNKRKLTISAEVFVLENNVDLGLMTSSEAS